mgnify:FL=1
MLGENHLDLMTAYRGMTISKILTDSMNKNRVGEDSYNECETWSQARTDVCHCQI